MDEGLPTSEWEDEPARRRSNHAGGVAVGSEALNTAPRFRVGDTDSYKIAAIVDKAIAEADAARREPL